MENIHHLLSFMEDFLDTATVLMASNHSHLIFYFVMFNTTDAPLHFRYKGKNKKSNRKHIQGENTLFLHFQPLTASKRGMLFSSARSTLPSP